MPSIGDITGRVVITDAGSATVAKVGTNIDAAAKTIMASMSRATLATETAVREITSKLAKLKIETKETAAGKGLVNDLDSLIKKRAQELTALKAGPAAIEALNQKRYQEAQALKIAAAQVDAGVSAESYLGRTIAANIKTLDRYEQELDQVAKAQARAAQRAEQQVAAYRKLSDVGQTLTTRVTLPLIAIGVGAVKVASDFESSFAGVRKTVDATEAEFAQLQAQLRALAAGPDAIPIDVNKLNAVAEAAGQLGIAKADIVAFTRTMADLGQTTNLTADEAATATAQFQNIFGAAGKDADRFASTLVALGNAGASTEKDIISMGLRIAGAGVQIGLSQGQVLAWASALSDVGIEAEAGGSAISKTMLEISLAVSKGGTELQNFASVAGMSVAEFSKLFRDDASVAVQRFIEGLARIKSSGGDTVLILDQMGITEQRMRDALNRASGSSDSLARSLKLQGEAWRDNNALTDEAKKRYQTFESQLQLFLNRVKDVTITFGTALLPVLLDTLDALEPWIDTLKSMVEGFAATSPGFKTFVVGMAAIVAAAGPVVFITGQLLLAWSQIVAHAPAVVTALRSVAVATQGLVVIGVLLFINEIIKAWGRASEAVTQYNLEVAKIEGASLDFVRRVSQGLTSVSQEMFDVQLANADKLKEKIHSVTKEINDMTMGGKLSEEDIRFSGIQPFKDFKAKQAELESLWKTYGKLRTTLAGVTIAGKEVEAAFDPSPFAGLATDTEKATDVIGDLTAELIRQQQAIKLLQDGMPVEQIDNLLEAARELESVNLFDPLVRKAAGLKDKIDAITTAFDLADEAKKRFADAGDDLDTLIKKQFDGFGGNDPEMQKLIATLREAKSITDSVKSTEQKRMEIIARANQLYKDGHITIVELQAVLLANADQWTVELDETQVKFNEIYEKLSYIAEGIAYDLVANWRRAWEENESLTDATLDTLKTSALDWVQDIVSHWLSTWAKAIAAWVARMIAAQRTVQASGAMTGGGGFQNSSSGLGNFAYGYGKQAATGSGVGAGGMSAGVEAYGGWALAAFALYVVYKGFVERERKKFAQVTIADGSYQITASRGQKYLDGVSEAAESILANLKTFLDDIQVKVERLGTVIIESSKSGWNVSIPGSTGKLFSSMEEAISYAQVLALKYAQFADSVSVLVAGVIKSSKAISIEQLASDIAFAKELETQNLEQAALDVQRAMDVAIAQWKRAEELFLGFYDRNLPAFAEAATSILTRLGNSLWATYNQLAGIEEDPEKAWQRQKAAYNAQRLLVLAQLKLWELEIAARIANYNAQRRILGGGGPLGPGKDGGGGEGTGGGLIGIAAKSLMVASILADAAGIIDPALQALLDIQALITQAINETPPELTDADYPGGKKGNRGGGRNRREMREDIRDELRSLEAEAQGSLHTAFNDLNMNLAAFRERAKEAKLPAAELARGVELLTEAFRRSVRAQARDMAGLDSEVTRRLREIRDFFAEVRALGPDATGISAEEADNLESQAIEKVGAELSRMIMEFAGLVDPMLAINMRASELRSSVLAFAEAAGWSAEQIDAAMDDIDRGVEAQRLQGINTALGNLFGFLRQAGLFEQDRQEFERRDALLRLQIIEAQLRLYGALDAATQAWIDAAREFINSPEFFDPPDRNDISGRSSVVAVRVVEDDRDMFSDLFDDIRSAIEDWREAIDDFAKSTEDLLTNEELTNLTQEQQLAFAKGRFEELLAKANAGDIEALKMLEAAREEYLKELRESEGAGYGFDKAFNEIMLASAEILKNAKSGEENLIDTMLEGWSVPIHRLPDLLEGLDTTIYDGMASIVNAIYEAIGGVPGLATGGVVMRGPRLVRVAEYVPEAIVPLDRLANMIPYRAHTGTGYDSNRNGSDNQRSTHPVYDFGIHDSIARLDNIARSNERTAAALRSVKEDIGAIRRRT